jgi:anti-sigma regulatory factor (Ser/Thr protein kinase)
VSGDVIKLEFPARPEYILAVRLVVSAIAERGGFAIEDIEDLKVASAEACILLMDASPETLDIRITVGDGLSLELMALGQSGTAGASASEEGLSQYLLEALVDSCEIREEGGVVKLVRFAKRP